MKPKRASFTTKSAIYTGRPRNISIESNNKVNSPTVS